MNNIPLLLTRFNLYPPGVRCPDGSWKLLKTGNNDYKDILTQCVQSVANSNESQNGFFVDNWNYISSKEAAAYLRSRHPNIRFLDFSECCDLTILTHIQATGTNQEYWIGHGRAGSTHFNKTDAQARTISETLERTLLSECQISLSEIWGSAIAPTMQQARHLSSLECLERWITTNAWKGTPSFKFLKIENKELTSSLIEITLFEWEIYRPNIEIFAIENPYRLPVVLVKIEIIISNKKWVFFANGIGVSLETAIEKAFLESIQYVPGKDELTWEAILAEYSSQVNRICEWQNCRIICENNPSYFNQNYSFPNSLDDIVSSIQGEIEVHSNEECPNIFLGCVRLSHRKNWNSYKGIPIS